MLNGRYDYYYPVLACQEPMFKLLGSAPGQKRLILYDAGHDLPAPRWSERPSTGWTTILALSSSKDVTLTVMTTLSACSPFRDGN